MSRGRRSGWGEEWSSMKKWILHSVRKFVPFRIQINWQNAIVWVRFNWGNFVVESPLSGNIWKIRNAHSASLSFSLFGACFHYGSWIDGSTQSQSQPASQSYYSNFKCFVARFFDCGYHFLRWSKCAASRTLEWNCHKDKFCLHHKALPAHSFARSFFFSDNNILEILHYYIECVARNAMPPPLPSPTNTFSQTLHWYSHDHFS